MSQDDPLPSPPLGSFAAGALVIEGYLKTMPASPGCYRMLDKAGGVLYVGKAKNLKKRVVAYTKPERLPIRIQRMVSQTVSMEIVTTHTEVEALLLEANLIKRLMPRYNILLKDDKSFPYILITGDHAWAQLLKHRGARGRKGEYFGPFASAASVNQTLGFLQRAFLLRSCTDAVFQSRTRPCLLFQIKRCSAPCVDRISRADYDALVDQARAFLSGRSQEIQQNLARLMEQAADEMAYEQAAVYRDRIRALSRIVAHQDINAQDVAEADVIALHQAGGQACIQVFFFRGGCNFGNRSFFPAQTQDQSAEEVLAAFIGQFYDDKPPPAELMLSNALADEDEALLTQALSQKAGRKVTLSVPKRGDRRKLMEHAYDNAREALGRRMAESSAQRKLLEGLGELFGLDQAPARVEIYDNSHIQGTNAVGGMIVAGPEGFLKNEYRKFNIKSEELTPGDDYGMMREVLTRRFKRAQKEDPERDRGGWPDLVLIDGGKGQLNVVLEVFAELGVEDVGLVSISKGPDRNAGREKFHMEGRDTFTLPVNDPLMYFLQRLRDEAHRFAIGSHRTRRAKAIGVTTLDDVAGIGAARKKALLHHFGSAKGVADAGLADLEAVDGISKALAQKIYDHFHPAG